MKNKARHGMERTTNADINSAFRDWLALTKSEGGNNVGQFRLGYDGYGKIRIEQVISKSGGIHVLATGMARREFLHAVYFLKDSLQVINDKAYYVID